MIDKSLTFCVRSAICSLCYKVTGESNIFLIPKGKNIVLVVQHKVPDVFCWLFFGVIFEICYYSEMLAHYVFC